MSSSSGLRIAAIHNASNGATTVDDEWVQIVNAGTQRWESYDWELVAGFGQQLRPDVFHFPIILPGITGGWWTFDPGESIYVFTGPGVDSYHPHPPDGRRPQFHFFWGLDSMAWTNRGDRAFLRPGVGLPLTEPFPVP